MNIKTSPLVRAAEDAERPTPSWAAWLVGIAIIFAGLVVGGLVGEAVLGKPPKDAPLHQFVDFFGFGMVLVFLYLRLRFKEGRTFSSVGLRSDNPLAIIGTSAIFSALHRDFDPVPFANIVLYAVFACFVALGDGSLWRICGLHGGWNYCQGNIFGLPVSGNAEGTSLWNFGPAPGSNELVTGGNFGVEASLMGTAVLTVALAAAVVHYRRQEARRAS